ncbi:hypothetical protein SAMN04488023_14329 [Pedobacter rhizosphaerae]|uniref:Uncharacterized protein n=1 Tax=Pedobacter rhizosphaerae TaxID=390241 RepID=A0A1H9VIC8_9SPHI|nr:hypothetical protein SAMN04488023_14329 [Pedobacter rhizosphaerae]
MESYSPKIPSSTTKSYIKQRKGSADYQLCRTGLSKPNALINTSFRVFFYIVPTHIFVYTTISRNQRILFFPCFSENLKQNYIQPNIIHYIHLICHLTHASSLSKCSGFFFAQKRAEPKPNPLPNPHFQLRSVKTYYFIL